MDSLDEFLDSLALQVLLQRLPVLQSSKQMFNASMQQTEQDDNGHFCHACASRKMSTYLEGHVRVEGQVVTAQLHTIQYGYSITMFNGSCSLQSEEHKVENESGLTSLSWSERRFQCHQP